MSDFKNGALLVAALAIKISFSYLSADWFAKQLE